MQDNALGKHSLVTTTVLLLYTAVSFSEGAYLSDPHYCYIALLSSAASIIRIPINRTHLAGPNVIP